MSSIPPDIVGSSLQAGFVQREAARGADSARTGQAQSAEQQVRAVDEASGNVETDDADTQVHADTEGSGSQGRRFSEEPEEEANDLEDGETNPTSTDGPRHLDIEA